MAIINKQHKQYSRPRKLFEAGRIKEENELVKKYGLKNKREIWKANSMVRKIREQAKKFITASLNVQEELISRLANKGLLKKGSKIDDVLDLKKENVLDRRLQTVVFKKGLAKTPKEARQMIVHRHVILKGHIVNIPSYQVNLKEESEIKLKGKKPKETKEKVVEEKANASS